MQKPNTDISGKPFSEFVKKHVWEKGIPAFLEDPEKVRKDCCGALMHYNEFGNTSSRYGWEIDHIRPKSHGGVDDIANLQPLHWENNRGKAENFPHWECRHKSM